MVAFIVLITVSVGLLRVMKGPGDANRMMAAQLVGTGGVAVVLMLSVATGVEAALDVALTLALLAAFASIAFYQSAPGRNRDDTGDGS